jgi:HAD superfamily hydrolase (TIGR01509 family)
MPIAASPSRASCASLLAKRFGPKAVLTDRASQDGPVAHLQALLVDVGGTLVRDDTWIPLADYRDRMAARVAALYDGAEPGWVRDLLTHEFAAEDAPQYEHGIADEVAAFLAERGYVASVDEVERICRACALPLHEVVEVEPDARAALEAARRRGLRIAICSNTFWRNDDDSRRDWTELGMADLFDAYVTSNGTGFAKPHPRIFQRALRLLDAHPDGAAMVGDQLSRDIAGAKALGIRTIWKRPAGHNGPVEPRPDVTITSLAELEPVLEDWGV